jgi:predicted glycosyltransferase
VNGTGVGHIARLLAISRWLRRYAALLGHKLEVWFLTSSEADSLAFAEGFAAFKIPSKTIAHEAGLERRAYVALAKQWVWHTLGLLRPDLLVVDTFPRGSFGELIGAFDLCRHTAFVYRPVRPEVAARPDFQAMLGLYDLIVVPEESARVLVPEKARDRVSHVGPVLGRERWELLPRESAREKLGIREGSTCVFVSAGGGGDPDAEGQVRRVLRALRPDPSFEVVVGTGPLYRGDPLPGITVVPGRAAEWSLAFDVAVSAAGYNTYNELMFAGVPTAFLPQEKLVDDQAARARGAVDAGAAILLEREWVDARIRDAVKELSLRPHARAAAMRLVPENAARHAAAELLRLVTPARAVDRAVDALTEERLVRRHDERSWLELAHGLSSHGDDLDVGEALDGSGALLAMGEPRLAKEILGIVEAVVRASPERTVRERVDASSALLAALAPLRPGDGTLAKATVTSSNDVAALARAIRGVPQEGSPSSSLSTK